jgi:hypothetical protein
MAKKRYIKSPEELFRKAVDPNNFISTFILGHLWIECLLVQIVRVHSPKLAKFTEKLNHSRLIEFVYGLELLNEKQVESLVAINTMRNKLAHNITYEPSVQEYRNLVLTAQKAFSDMTDGFEQALAELEGKNNLKDCEEFIYPEIFMQIAYDLEAIYVENGGKIDSFI